MAPSLDLPITRELRDIVGPAGYLETVEERAPFLVEWRGFFRSEAPLVLLPGATDEVAAILALCSRHGIGVVPQGGNTGLVGGAVARSTPEEPQIIVSARRMAAIRDLDPDNYTITAESGCVLASLQAAATEADRFFPLSLAAEGSCPARAATSRPMPGAPMCFATAPPGNWCWDSRWSCLTVGFSTGCGPCARTTPVTI